MAIQAMGQEPQAALAVISVPQWLVWICAATAAAEAVNDMRNNSRKIAICGITGALAAVIMLMGGIIPFATYVAPAIAGLLIIPIAIEFGLKSGMLLYVSISFLSFFIVPDKEMVFIFIFLLGYYPLLKAKLEKIKHLIIRLFAKLVVFNASVLAVYGLMIFVFRLDMVVAEFKESGIIFIAVLLVMANFTFLIYDFAIKRLAAVYCIYVRPRLEKLH